MGDRVYDLTADQFVGEQAQTPPGLTGGWGAAGDRKQAGLGLPIEPPGIVPIRAGGHQGGVQPVRHELVADAGDGDGMHLKGAGNHHIGPARSGLGTISLEQDPGAGHLVSGGDSAPHPGPEVGALGIGEHDTRGLGHGTTSSRQANGHDLRLLAYPVPSISSVTRH